MKKMVLIAAALCVVIGAAAQPGNKKCNCNCNNKQQVDKPSPEQMVQKRVDKMASELQLSDVQVEQLNKLFLDDMAYRRENFKNPEGSKPDFKAGEHKKREFTEEDKARFEKMKEYSIQQEEKLKEILGDDLYAKWRESHPIGNRPNRPNRPNRHHHGNRG